MGTDIKIAVATCGAVECVSAAHPAGVRANIILSTVSIERSSFDVHRNYFLFSWLAGIRGPIQPLLTTEEEIRLSEYRANAFLHMAARAEDVPRSALIKRWLGDGRDLSDFHLLNVSFLLQFDYDQVVMVSDDKGGFAPHSHGATYRQLFSTGSAGVWHDWFAFLEYCKGKSIDFILIGFN